MKILEKKNLSYPYDVISVPFCWNQNSPWLLEKDLLYLVSKHDDCCDNRFRSYLVWDESRAKKQLCILIP